MRDQELLRRVGAVDLEALVGAVFLRAGRTGSTDPSATSDLPEFAAPKLPVEPEYGYLKEARS